MSNKHKVFQAHRKDGSYYLIPDTLINEYVRESKLIHPTNKAKQFRTLCQFLSHLCYCRNFDIIESITYSLDSLPVREIVLVER